MLRHSIAVALVAGFALAGFAHADEGRGRVRQPTPVNWELRRAIAPPLANVSATIQQGSGNAATIAQTGAGNTAGIRQFGRGNTGAIQQAGNNNTACLIQAGRNLDGAIQQAGDNQSSGLLQTRWGTREIPAEVCASVSSRGDVMAWNPDRGEPPYRWRGR